MSINFESRLISLNENLMSQQFLPISSFHFSRSKVITVSSLPQFTHPHLVPAWSSTSLCHSPNLHTTVYAAIMSFFFLIAFIYLRGMETGRETDLSASSLPKSLPSPGAGRRPKPGAKNTIQVSHVGSRSPTTCVITTAFSHLQKLVRYFSMGCRPHILD